MKAFILRLVNTENALRVAALLLFMHLTITDGLLCTTDTGAYLQTISNIESHGLAGAIPMDRSVFYGLFLWAGKHWFGLSPLLSVFGISLNPPHVFIILLVPCILLLTGLINLSVSIFKSSSIICGIPNCNLPLFSVNCAIFSANFVIAKSVLMS